MRSNRAVDLLNLIFREGLGVSQSQEGTAASQALAHGNNKKQVQGVQGWSFRCRCDDEVGATLSHPYSRRNSLLERGGV